MRSSLWTSVVRVSPSTLGGGYEAGVPRFLFSSPGSLNGAARNKPVDETGLFNLVTPYGESKATA